MARPTAVGRVVYLSTYQGRQGESDPSFRDEGLNGCTGIVASSGSAHLIGSLDCRLLNFIIDEVCQSLNGSIRAQLENYSPGDYSLVSWPEALRVCVSHGLLPPMEVYHS